MLDRRLVEQVAGALATDEGLVEKDWYVVRALAVVTAVDHGDALTGLSRWHVTVEGLGAHQAVLRRY